MKRCFYEDQFLKTEARYKNVSKHTFLSVFIKKSRNGFTYIMTQPKKALVDPLITVFRGTHFLKMCVAFKMFFVRNSDAGYSKDDVL